MRPFFGSRRDVFEITFDQRAKRLGIRLSGFWSDETATAFGQALKLELARAERLSTALCTLSDATDFPVQSPSVSATFGTMMASLGADRHGKLAIVVASTLNKLQAERNLGSQMTRGFLDRDTALRWLDTNDRRHEDIRATQLRRLTFLLACSPLVGSGAEAVVRRAWRLERMQGWFRVEGEREACLIRLTMGGFFDSATIGQMRRELVQAIVTLSCPANAHNTLCDIREMVSKIVGSEDVRSRRLAFVTAKSLARLQARRLTSREGVEFFSDIEPALRWLQERIPD